VNVISHPKIIIGTIHILKTEYVMLCGKGQAVGKEFSHNICDSLYGPNNYELGYNEQYTLMQLWNSHTPLGNEQYETE
jgi:hypothetical protein